MNARFDTATPIARDVLLARGRVQARFTRNASDMAAVQSLRARVFRAESGAPSDRDRFDDLCRHLVIEDRETGGLLGSLRLLYLPDGSAIERSYAAQFYDVSRLARYPGAMLEIGRFCLEPQAQDGDALRVAWGALAALVDAERIEMLFGCTSFAGTDAAPYRAAFAWLQARHLAPAIWSPGRAAPQVMDLAGPDAHVPDPRRAVAEMPALLRTYLAMGGWVSDHAVIDDDLGTLHVFTGVEIKSIPPARARALRAIATAG